MKNAVGKAAGNLATPELKDSKEWYLPESWVKELARACERGDEAAIRELVGRARRDLLVHTFEDTHLGGKTVSQLAVAASTHNNNNKALLVVVELLEKRKRGAWPWQLCCKRTANERGHCPAPSHLGSS